MSDVTLIQSIVIWAMPVLLAFVVHEVSHGYVANILGDHTAKYAGRLTLNPFKHLDLIGTILLPLLCLIGGKFIFGWVKPIPLNPRNLKNLSKDIILIAIAGPLANLFMAMMWALGIKIIMLFLPTALLPNGKLFLIYMGYAGISINILLLVFNLIPIPPLDGSKIIAHLLPQNIATLYNNLEPYGWIILIILIYCNALSFVITPLLQWLQHNLLQIFAI